MATDTTRPRLGDFVTASREDNGEAFEGVLFALFPGDAIVEGLAETQHCDPATIRRMDEEGLDSEELAHLLSVQRRLAQPVTLIRPVAGYKSEVQP